MLQAIRSRLRAVVRRGALDREMRGTMSLHLEQATERLTIRGPSGTNARGARWIDSLSADVHFALRHFSRTPITAITLVLVLALGIGVNSVIFSVLQAFILRAPPAVAVDESLVRVRGTVLVRSRGRLRPREFSGPELNALARQTDTFASVAGWSEAQLMLDLGDGANRRAVRGHFVTPNYFATLGVRPAFGPGLPAVRTDDGSGAELAVVIGHSLWKRLGADSTMVARVVRINGIPLRVVGVAPDRFQGPVANPDDGAQLWVPLDARAQLVRSTASALTSRDSTFLQAVARLTPTTTRERATSVARVVSAAWIPSDPRMARELVEYSTHLAGLSGGDDLDVDYILGFTLAVTAALLILLIICTNVSALLVGAGVARRREIAIRLSLGASRTRIVRQLVTETSLIAMAGGALGLATYWSIFQWFKWRYGDDLFPPDVLTVAFTAFVALGTGIVFGLSPALHATRIDVSDALKNAAGGATTRSRLQRTFIVAQICLTQPLLIGLVMVMSIARLEFATLRADDPLAARLTEIYFNAGDNENTGTPNAKHRRIREVMERVAALPGVERVTPEPGTSAAEIRVPAGDRGSGARAGEVVRARVAFAPPGYFAFRDVRLIRGRDIVPDDTAGREIPVVIGNDLARAFWGSTDPIGKRLEMWAGSSGVVVGVFDTSHVAVEGANRVFTAHGGGWWKNSYLIRTRGPGTSIIPSVREIVYSTIPDIQIYGLATLEQKSREGRTGVMVITSIAAGGGLLALLLASIGLYGVIALAVRQQHREIGIRVALGARPQQVITMFFASGLRLSMLGIALGLPLSVVAVHLLMSNIASSYLDVRWLVGGGGVVAALVVVVASLATWIPARRAAGVDPLMAIRVE